MDISQETQSQIQSQDNLPVSKKKGTLVFLVLLFFTMLVLAFGLIFSFVSKQNKYPKVPTETGATLSQPEEIPSLDQFYTLMEKTPIVHERFVLESDYKKNKLVVTLSSPIEESKNIFLDWLKTSGYVQIPEEKIIYQEGK